MRKRLPLLSLTEITDSANIVGPVDDIICGERVATPWATRDVTPQ